MEELDRSLADLVFFRPRKGTFEKNKSKFPALRAWSVIAPRTTNGQIGWPSGRDRQRTRSSLVGMVLARRYKILEAIEADGFKAHDLALDQTVTIRRVLVNSQRGGDTWREEVRQLALVNDPNFLNVIDVIFDNSKDFIVTERPRGRSMADLLRERSALELGEVMRLVTPLAGALDLAAAFSCCPNPISTSWLFIETTGSFATDLEPRALSDWPPFLVKLDVWELVRPRKSDIRPFLTAKAQSGGSRALAVRRAALLAYELLGGGRKRNGQVQRRFKPVSKLSDASNDILYLGLQGSPLFATSESFFHKLESSIQSGERGSRVFHAPQMLESSVALPVIHDVIRSFNRDTVWLASLVGGAVVSAALMFAVLDQNSHSKSVDSTKKPAHAGSDLSWSANSAKLFKVDMNGKESPVEINQGQASRPDRAPNEISAEENADPPTEAATSAPTPVLAFAPATNPLNEQANTTSRSPANWPHFGREIRPKSRNEENGSSVAHRSVDVRTRLIALWHQSLARRKNTRSSKTPTKLNGGIRKKGNQTTATSH